MACIDVEPGETDLIRSQVAFTAGDTFTYNGVAYRAKCDITVGMLKDLGANSEAVEPMT